MREILEPCLDGFFFASDDDESVSRALLDGVKEVAGRSFNPTDPQAYNGLGELGRTRLLDLHALRWIDPLRRIAPSKPEALRRWHDIVEAWSRSDAARDETSLAWSEQVVERRSLVLALAMDPRSSLTSLIEPHLQLLAAMLDEAVSASRALHLLRIRLGLLELTGCAANDLRSEAVRSAKSVFTRGYCIADDLEGIIEARGQWKELLTSVGVPAADAVWETIEGRDFWIHNCAPNGAQTRLGVRAPGLSAEIEESDRLKYIVSGGAQGSPPSVVRDVNPNGIISSRSGWGETERDVEGETHFTFVSGPVRGRDAHQDVGRVTFHSQGRAWLVDPGNCTSTKADAHSVVSVAGRRYRDNGGAEIVRQYVDDSIEGYRANLTVHHGVQWQRHVVFSRSSYYLFVEDMIRSSSEYEAFQEWIIAPDVEIYPYGRGFKLSADGKWAALVISCRGLREHIVDDLFDLDGERVAKRIRIPLSGRSSRAIGVFVDIVDRRQFDVRRIALPGKEVVFDIRDKGVAEKLVVTPDLAGIVALELDPDAAVEQIVARGAAGDLSPEEQLAQRYAARRAIAQVKEDVWAEGGSIQARRSGIQRLREAGKDLRIGGLRDHGYAAALIDFAGDDLRAEILDDPQVANARRSGLIEWPGSDAVQSSYNVPIRTSGSADLVPEFHGTSEIWSVDYGQLVLSSYVMESAGDVLTVYFHGATDRSKFSMPRYERLRSMGELGLGPVMFFSDPCLDLDSRMMLSWYVGTEDLDLHHEIARMVLAYARSRRCEKVLVVGNSGGGFAALQLGAHLSGARVVSFNPQVRIDDYTPRISEVAHWALFGRDTVADDPVNAPRMDLIERYRRIGFDQDVELVQNPGDDHHYQEHFLPFCAAFEDSGQGDRLIKHTPYLGPGHRVPPVDEYLDYVRRAAARPSERPWKLSGLRS